MGVLVGGLTRPPFAHEDEALNSVEVYVPASVNENCNVTIADLPEPLVGAVGGENLVYFPPIFYWPITVKAAFVKLTLRP